jgi:hypothetical protein
LYAARATCSATPSIEGAAGKGKASGEVCIPPS